MAFRWTGRRRLASVACCHVVFVVLGVAGCGSSLQPEPRQNPMNTRAALLERIGDINNPALPRPLVGFELFFEGNNDYGSIGCNLPGSVHPSEFYVLLQQLRDRQDVHEVLIEVKDLEDPDGWPFSDTIWFITSAKPADVRAWFPDRLSPDDVIDGFERNPERLEPYAIPDGLRAVGAWYD